MRFLIYSQDGLGLGHLRRTRNIAREILAREPDSSILVLADSPVAPFFSPLRGVDYLKFPSVRKVGTDQWRTNTLTSLTIEETLNLRAELMVRAFCEFKPDVVLVDHRPVGLLGELKPLLDAATQRARRPKLFLGLRDILDAPEVIVPGWTRLGAYEYLRQYDAIFIYGCREIYDADTAYRMSPYAQRIVYCSYVAHRPEARYPVRFQGDPFVLVMGGGGADAFPLARAFLEALPPLLERLRLRALILTGPNMPRAEREALVAESKSFPVEVHTSSKDATQWLRKASAVVTMGGYNTLSEVLAWRRKALVVPLSGPSAEQRMRGQLFAQRQLVKMLAPDNLTPYRLAQELFQLLTENEVPEPGSIPPVDGAQRAATLLLGGSPFAEESAAAGELAGTLEK